MAISRRKGSRKESSTEKKRESKKKMAWRIRLGLKGRDLAKTGSKGEEYRAPN